MNNHRLPGSFRVFWRRKTKGVNMKNFIFIRSLGQHKAVLSKESGVKIVETDKEAICQYSHFLNRALSNMNYCIEP